MAQIATLTDTSGLVTIPLEFIRALPIGDLNEPVVVSSPPDAWSAPILANRFPIPPSASAFLGTGTVEIDWPDPPAPGLMPPYFIIGAVYPETKYLEPTIGQIWPR